MNWLNWLGCLMLVWVVFLINTATIVLIPLRFFCHGTVSPHHHYRYRYQQGANRPEMALRSKVENRRLLKNVQSLHRHYSGSFHSVWPSGWSQMTYLGKLRDTHHAVLGKPRLLKFITGYILGGQELHYYHHNYYYHDYHPHLYHSRRRSFKEQKSLEKLSIDLTTTPREYR